MAQYTVENINRLGGRAVTLSDSTGFIYDKDGIDAEKLAWVMDLKNVRRGRISEYADQFGVEYYDGHVRGRSRAPILPFPVPHKTKLTWRTPNVSSKTECTCCGGSEHAHRTGCNPAPLRRVLYGPGKAANAGGVATSGLEMSQNAGYTAWSREEVDARCWVS